jgi:F420-dependent oxidoreductase-like protein
MQVAISLPIGHSAAKDWETLVTYTREAQRLGVAFVWSAEAWNQDAFTPLAYLAAITARIRLGTGVAQAGTRTPALLAMTALTLAQMSGDRFVLGLGTSGPQVIEGWHGLRFERPVTRMREIVEIVRMVTRGERLVYKGQMYQLPLQGGEGKALRTGIEPRFIPIYLAALSPKSLEMTGELADGWLGTSFMPEHANVFLEHIAAGATRAGRTLADLDLQVNAVVHFTDDVEQAVAQRKPDLAFQLGAMGSREHNFYTAAYCRAGYEAEARRVQELWLAGRRGEAAAAVPDDLVLRSNLIGTEAMVRERLRRYRDAGITTLRLSPVGASLTERLKTLERAIALVNEVSAEHNLTP